MATKTILTTLGETIGTMFARAATIFAQKGNVSPEFDTLEKLEALIRQLNKAVFEGTAENDLDTLAEISAFLAANKDKIITSGSHLTTADIINTLDSTDTTKPLAAAQGKALKTLIDTASASISGCLTSANGHTDTEIAKISQTLTAISTALADKAGKTETYLKTEIGTTDEFTAAFSQAAGNTYK